MECVAGLCSAPWRLRISSLWSLLSALWASGPWLLAGGALAKH